MTTELFISAIALALIIEGMIPALFPNKWRSYILKLTQEPISSIRTVGVVLVCLGTLLLWLN